MSASASFIMATQCQLNEAMELLDPTPPSSLTEAGIAKAYDCLLSAASPSSSVAARTGDKEHGGGECSLQHNQQKHPSTAHGSDELVKQSDDPWCALQADIYRALLLSAHLLLGMAPRGESGHKKDDSDNSTSGCPPTSNPAIGDGTVVVLTPGDVTTLQQTQRRCRLLLLELAEISHARQYGGQSRANGGHATDWHDDILPRSSFQLLRECFEISDTNPDGSKERLVSLDIDFKEEEMCHLSASDGVERRGAAGESPSNDVDDVDDVDDADIGFVSFDRKLLEREENELLDIAMPIDSEALATKRSPKKGKKRKHNTNDKTSSLPSSVAKQGCLVLVDDHKFRKEAQGESEATSSNRYFVKVYRSGVLYIQLAGNKKAATVQFYLGADNCVCQPRPLGDTFHFSLEAAQRLNSNARDASLCPVDGKPEMIFKVDEKTGGGLAEGFAWVTAITEVADDASKRREHQEKIRQEWSDSGEWGAVAKKQQIKDAVAV